MSGFSVTGSDGVTWTVRRRWMPWRGPVSFREMWHSPSEKDSAVEDPAATEEPPGAALRVLQLTVGVVLWVIIYAGKAVLIALAAVFMVSLWLINLVLQLLALHFVLIARVCGLARWPVQIDRQYAHFRTEHAKSFEDAATLRDGLAAQIGAGTLDGMHEAATQSAA
ncbi:MAG: hypothetical protein ACSLFA_13185 [Mycobacterium sp.]